MGLTLDIAANTRAAVRSVGDVGDALDKVADSLDDVARESQQDASRVETALDKAADAGKDMGRDIESAGDRVEKSFRNMVSDAKAADRAVSQVGDSGSKSLRQVSDVGSEASAELKQNLGETFSSFRGDLEDLPQIAQDVFGGLAGSVGGILPAIGLAAGAAGIGLLIQAFQDGGAESDAFKAKAAELAQAYIDAGGEAAPAIEDIADAIKELATATEDGQTSLKDLRDIADKSGNSFEDLAQAYAGNVSQLEDMIRVGEQRQQQLEDEAQAYDETNRQGERHYGIIQGEAEAQGRYNDYLREAKDAADLAAESERNWREAGGEELAIKAELVDDIASAYDGVRDAAIGAATNEEGVFDVAKWAEHVEATKAQVEAYKSNLEGLKLTPEQWSNLMDMPESARMSVVASLASGPEEAKGRIVNALTDAGASAASGAQVSFEEGFNPSADVEVEVDTSEGEARVTELTRPRDMTVRVGMDTTAVDAWRPPRKTLTVDTAVDTSAVDRALSRLQGRTIYVDIEARNRTGVPFL